MVIVDSTGAGGVGVKVGGTGAVGVGLGVEVGVAMRVAVGLGIAVDVAVGLGDAVGVGVGVGVGMGVGVDSGIDVAVGVARVTSDRVGVGSSLPPPQATIMYTKTIPNSHTLDRLITRNTCFSPSSRTVVDSTRQYHTIGCLTDKLTRRPMTTK